MTCLIKLLVLVGMIVFSFLTTPVDGQTQIGLLKTAKIIMQTITSTFDSGYKCTTLIVVNNSSTDSNEYASYTLGQKMIFTGNFMAIRKEYISSVLKTQVSCLVGVSLDKGNIGNVAYALRKNWQHVTLKIGGVKPLLSEVTKATYPIIHIEEEPKQNVNLFCPKFNPQNSAWQTPFSAKLLERSNEKSKLFCSGYLEGQNAVRAGPYINEVRIVDGKLEYGDFGVRMNNYLSKKYKYNDFNIMGPSTYFAHNDSWGGVQAMVIAGHYFLTAGRQTPQFQRHFELLLPSLEASYAFVSRKPKILERVDNILLPFSMDIWVLVIITMFSFSAVFYVAYSVYSKNLRKHNFHRKEDSPINFLLYTICKITEPDPVPWFTEKWSAGKLLSFQWSLFCLLIVAIYTCNLRAHFAAVDYEKAIDTTKDVVESGKKTFLLRDMLMNSKAYLEMSGQSGKPYYKVVERATEMNSFWGISDFGLPEAILEEIVHEGAVAVYHREYFNHRILFNPRYQHILTDDNDLYISKENAFTLSFCAVLAKYSPVRVEINTEFMWTTELGLMYKWQNELYPLKYYLNWNELTAVNEGKPLKFLQMFVPQIFGIFGCILGILTFLGEGPRPRKSIIKVKRILIDSSYVFKTRNI